MAVLSKIVAFCVFCSIFVWPLEASFSIVLFLYVKISDIRRWKNHFSRFKPERLGKFGKLEKMEQKRI